MWKISASLATLSSVKPGYGRNYLLPQGLATDSLPGNLKVFEKERKKLQARMDALARGEARGLQAVWKPLEIIIPMHVGENDKLLWFSYFHHHWRGHFRPWALMLIAAGSSWTPLSAPLGEHPARIPLHADVIAVVPVKVVSDHAPIVEEVEEEIEKWKKSWTRLLREAAAID